MSRLSEADRLVEMARGDPRLRTIPASARWIWFMLVDALLRLPKPGVFAWGERAGTAADVAQIVSVPEPEAKTCLDILLENGLLIRNADGICVLPEPLAERPGSSTSAENGRKSLGRPRKGESADQYRLRLLRRVDGDLEKPEEPDPDKPPRGRARSTRLLSSTSSSKKEANSKVSNPPEAVTQIAEKLVEVGNLTVAPRHGVKFIERWLAQGASEDLLLETFSAVAARPNYRPAWSFQYFGKPVEDAIANRPAPMDEEWDERMRKFDEEMAQFVRFGCEGPVPTRPRRQATAA